MVLIRDETPTGHDRREKKHRRGELRLDIPRIIGYSGTMMMNEEIEMTDFVPYTHPAVTRVYTASELARQLAENLLDLSENNYSYVAGYLETVLALVAKDGIDELVSAVDYTNQKIEVRGYNKRADARRQAWVDEEFGFQFGVSA